MVNLRARHVGTAQIAVREIGRSQITAIQIGMLQIGVIEVAMHLGKRKIDALKVSMGANRPMHLAMPKLRTGGLRAREVGEMQHIIRQIAA